MGRLFYNKNNRLMLIQSILILNNESVSKLLQYAQACMFYSINNYTIRLN
nr:MAG TPA: hypothetical protein [Caudoviricetes sp.]